MFILGHTPSFFVLLCLASFFGFSNTRSDSTFPSTCPDSTFFRYLSEPFSDTHPNSTPFPTLIRTLSQYSSWPFLGTRLDPFPALAWTLFVLSRTLLWYSPGPSLVLAEPFPGTSPDPYPVLARTIFWYSPEFYLFRYSLGFYPFPILTQIQSLLRYSPRYDPFCLEFFGTCPDLIPHLSRILQYSPEYYFFFDTHSNTICSLVLTRVLFYCYVGTKLLVIWILH